ncbi:uncharacterized protein LOC111885211 isoform X1 [Lactuca sativa]|uniref:uncharacterized protein LOC111885211 isoform X1 n=1 Tax=Lactuca sativa TaxID=4236 RepID=UPI000CD84B62|nr:uncharacterized protein LOC111885211 isoform X1 [Lactuca sativa]
MAMILNSLRRPERTFIFEIVSFQNCYGYEQKISGAVGNDFVKIDQKDGHVTVSTRLLPESVRLALEEKTRRKVVLLYELIPPHNPRSSLQPSSHHGHQHRSLASTSNHVATHSKSQTIKMTIRYQNQGTVVDARPGEGQNATNSLRRYGKIYHEHNLTLTKGNISSYKCSGCKELGIGDRYKCNHCSYILHPDCMYYTRITTHKFLDGSTFKFHQTRFDSKDRYCDACGSDIEGFFYHCEKTSKDLHPCCLKLTETVDVGETKFMLRRKLTTECFYCSSKKKDHKDNCWCYSLESQDMQVHVSCMKDALQNCLKGERNNNMSTMVVVRQRKQTSEGLKWVQRLLKVAVCVLSGNPFPLLEVALEVFE